MSKAREAGRIIRTALETTSLKGVPRILKTKVAVLKALWIVCTTALFVYVLYELQLYTREYLSYPSVINLREELPPDGVDPVFPTASICSLKPTVVAPNLPRFTMEDYLNQLHGNISQWKGAKRANVTKKEHYALDYLGSTVGYYQYLGMEKATEYGLTKDGFIQGCVVTSSFSDVTYDCDEVVKISTISTPNYFNCFAISFLEEKLETVRPIMLSLLLYVDDTEDYISSHYSQAGNDQQEHGVRMILHAPNDIVNIREKGMSFAPGYLHSVNMALTYRERLEAPYGTCYDSTTGGFLSRSGKNISYTQDACYSACLQKVLTDSCGCLDPQNKAVASMEELSLPFCARDQDSFSLRMSSTLCLMETKKASSEKCHMRCHVQCRELQINSKLSFSAWPRVSQQLAFYREVITGSPFAKKFHQYAKILDEYNATKNDTQAIKELSSLDLISRNFMKIDVIIGGRQIMVVSDQIKTSTSSLMATLGSLLNLYSGINCVVGIEILDLILTLALLVCCRESLESQQKEPNANQRKPSNAITYF